MELSEGQAFCKWGMNHWKISHGEKSHDLGKSQGKDSWGKAANQYN